MGISEGRARRLLACPLNGEEIAYAGGALANKMARGIWAMLTKQENYRNPATVPV